MKNRTALKDSSQFSKSVILFIFLFIIILQNTPTIAMFSAIKPLSYSTQQKKIISPIVRYILKKVPKANLLIFLDDQEVGEIGPIGSDLLIGLYERMSPIIVSSSLMSTVLKKRSSDNRSPETIMDQLSLANKLLMVHGKSKIEAEMNKRNEPIKASVNIGGDGAILVCKTLFNPDQWIIKKINNNLLLLIPDLYCASIGADIEKVKEDNNTSDESTITELLLGLKVNHLKTITYTEISTSFRSYLSSYIGILANYFVPCLNDIFCTKYDYSKTIYAIPAWIIYISGHGLIHDSIAYLSLNDFTQLLAFFNRAIRTQLLSILSCYVAGTNIEKVYQDVKVENEQCCSFPIIVQGLGNAIVRNPFIEVNLLTWIDKRKIESLVKKSFYGYFLYANEEEANYSKIVRPLYVFSGEITSTPQIKLPHLEWFSVLDSSNKISSIGSILVKTRDPQKPLDVGSFFKQKHLQVLLLYTDNIPFELIINTDLNDIIPMKTSGMMGDDSISTTIYRIKKISSKKYKLFEILAFFKSIEAFDGQKCIFIDEIESTTGLVKNVLIDGDYTTGMNAYYQENGILCKFNISSFDRVGRNKIRVEKFLKIAPDSPDEFHYNKGMMRYLIFHKRQGIKQGVTSQEIKRIKSALQSSIHKKVLESRKIKEDMQKELEEKRKARERTIIE